MEVSLSAINVEDVFQIVPIFERTPLILQMCIHDGYILLTSDTKIPFSKKEFFEHFAKTDLTGVSVILTGEDISVCSPGKNSKTSDQHRFILTREATEFHLLFAAKGRIENGYNMRKYSLEGIAEETEDLEWFSSYFSPEASLTNKLYLDGYRIYHEKVSRKDAYEDLLAYYDIGFIIVELGHNAELRIHNVSENHSRCAMYIVDVAEDNVKEYVHKTIKCSEGLYRIKNLVLTFPPLEESRQHSDSALSASRVVCHKSDLGEKFQEKAFEMYAMINGCLPYK